MGTSYVAFGLQIRCAFRLPGMPPRAARDLPALTVLLTDEETLEAAWSGSAVAGPSWRGRLGDGTRLTLERGRAGDLRMVNDERVSFRFDPTAMRLECAPADPAGIGWRRILLSRILPNVSVALGREALHASAVDAGGVIAFAGPSGAGKSTMAAEMLRRGHRHFTDDVLVLERCAGGTRAHPGSPHTNLALDGVGVTPEAVGETLEVQAGEAWAAVECAAEDPLAVAAVVLLDRRPGNELSVERLAPTPLHLAPYMLGLPDDEDGELRRFATCADLVEDAALLRLSAAHDDSPKLLADSLERVLDPPRMLEPNRTTLRTGVA